MTRTLTRRAALAGATLMAGVLLSACGSNDHGAMPSMGNGTGAAPSAGTAAAGNADVTFAQQMIPHHQQAVAMSTLANTRANDPEVKKLAGQIKAAQAPEIATMTAWLTTWGHPMTMPSTGHGMDMGGGTAMPGMMSDADMTKLTAATGTEFDKEFLRMMIIHHQGAITMAKDEIATGGNADAIALAKQIITAQEAEIVTMKTILAHL